MIKKVIFPSNYFSSRDKGKKAEEMDSAMHQNK